MVNINKHFLEAWCPRFNICLHRKALYQQYKPLQGKACRDVWNSEINFICLSCGCYNDRCNTVILVIYKSTIKIFTRNWNKLSRIIANLLYDWRYSCTKSSQQQTVRKRKLKSKTRRERCHSILLPLILLNKIATNRPKGRKLPGTGGNSSPMLEHKLSFSHKLPCVHARAQGSAPHGTWKIYVPLQHTQACTT